MTQQATMPAVLCPVLERHITAPGDCPILRHARPCCPAEWGGRAIVAPQVVQVAAQGALLAVEVKQQRRIDD